MPVNPKRLETHLKVSIEILSTFIDFVDKQQGDTPDGVALKLKPY